ncbi:PIG-L deacetylase family protein [Candidatus Poriferisocius sp.]|uniref:PIG-L deacetylase family protein n=1 Tax=Candidatus Poriferisocius sp. TaxID=3101276 RepID=UPI003B5B03EC
MRSRNLARPERALAIGAHPDDIELNAGATLAKWAAAGSEVSLVVCTDGSKGTWDPNADLEELVAVRQREQRESARRLGATGEVVFLGWVDGELASGPEPRRQVASWIRTLRPDVVLGHDPWRRWRLHPDHRHAGWLTVDGIVAARDPHFFPDLGLEPHRPDALLLFEADEPDHAEDAAGFASAKATALEAFVSQYETTLDLPPEPDAADRARLHAWVGDRLADAGASAGLDSAELFKLIDDL